ncbi:MAG: XRE family transcriptional regulator [Terracidiphilus sp.]|nr:XRE family transcriptional regulator [Terracidiphilus sp.]
MKSAGKSGGTDLVEESIRPYGISDKLRSLRLRKSMGLAQLAAHTGLSAAMLSKLENARLVPTLPTLVRIASVFDVGLDYFFTDPRKRHVVAISRREERIKLPEDAKPRNAAYEFESLNFRAKERKLNAFLAHFHDVPAEKTDHHYHAGVEFLYIMQGELEISIGTETYRLSMGDAIYFDSVQKHAYRSRGPKPCTAVVITAGA